MAEIHERWVHTVTQVRRFDHVGITVADLDAAIGFFAALGLEADEERRGCVEVGDGDADVVEAWIR